jgi:cell division protein ZapE
MSVRQAYQTELVSHGYSADPAQLRGIDALQHCALEWRHFKAQRSSTLKKLINHPLPPRGVYLCGGVGRGKSFLMDCFFDALALKRKTRLHFHEFMREVHGELAALQGTANPLDVLAKRIAQKHRLICFDEFHIADITDALILHRLLRALFKQGVGLVATSNFKPDDLYPGGMHRERILPAIALLKQRLEVIDVDNGCDYRCCSLEQVNAYLMPLGELADVALGQAFDCLAQTPDEDPFLIIEARQIRARRMAVDVVWFDFKTLCGGPRSQNDYLEIAERFRTVILSDVPYLPEHMASQARRFSSLIDVLYDRRVKLLVSAALAPEGLYPKGPLAYEFARTVSRLHEMQTPAYWALERRVGQTRLTSNIRLPRIRV